VNTVLAGLSAVGSRPDRSWRNRAACLGEDLDLFFPLPGPAAPAAVEKARAICARCPVPAACLAFAQDHVITSGVWGGLTPEERARRRRGQAEARRRERNAAIVAAAADGRTRDQLAAEFGVSASMVGKILADAQRGAA
jgi:WhiB family transcriptional regulator, redox-sensing transcriptional regulator